MFFTLLNWLWIGISCFLVGYAGISLLNRIVRSSVRSISMVFVFGVCLLTVYAEYFSLFYKVGILANALLLCGNVFILLFCRKGIKELLFKTVGRLPKGKKGMFVGCVVVILFSVMLVVTSSTINHYDTLLYHAQSIRWVEEYGIVKGLGNLHNRFAYNSSIFPLQALFSMPYVFGQSMHSVNGFIAGFFLIYAVVSMKCWHEKKIYVSDFIRLALIVCLNLQSIYKYISSSGSDTFAIGLFFYILIKVVSLIEDGEKDEAEFAYLCIIGVFAVSVKLSVAMIVFIVCIPLYRLINKRKWKEIGIYLLAGFLVILPFLIRNVIISGYLIYPYPSIDLFDVDWKMAEYTLLFDSKEIQIYGRGFINVLENFNRSFSEWFPIWLNDLSTSMRGLFFLNVILIPVSIIWGVWELKNKRGQNLCVVIVIIANLLLWFWGAPLIRYGLPFMFLLPFYMFANVASRMKKGVYFEKASVFIILLFAICCNGSLSNYAYKQMKEKNVDLKEPADYIECAYEEHSLDGEIVYVPTTTDQIGYYEFPSTPYKDMLVLIEMRGDSIEDGFRLQEVYKGMFVPNNGSISEVNIFSE